jgi:hypothetical protein
LCMKAACWHLPTKRLEIDQSHKELQAPIDQF